MLYSALFHCLILFSTSLSTLIDGQQTQQEIIALCAAGYQFYMNIHMETSMSIYGNVLTTQKVHQSKEISSFSL